MKNAKVKNYKNYERGLTNKSHALKAKNIYNKCLFTPVKEDADCNGR